MCIRGNLFRYSRLELLIEAVCLFGCDRTYKQEDVYLLQTERYRKFVQTNKNKPSFYIYNLTSMY